MFLNKIVVQVPSFPERRRRMSAFFSFVFLGISLSAPIGPINAAQLDKGIKNGFTHAWLVGVGAMLADACYMLLIYFGVAQFLNTSFMKTLLFLFGFFILVYTGIESILHSNHAIEGRRHHQESLLKSFTSGYLMALSNPLNILFWLGIYGAVLAKISSTTANAQLFLYSTGIFAGIMMWDLVMASVSSIFRRYFKPSLLQAVSMIAGVMLIGFGCYFGMQAIHILF